MKKILLSMLLSLSMVSGLFAANIGGSRLPQDAHDSNWSISTESNFIFARDLEGENEGGTTINDYEIDSAYFGYAKFMYVGLEKIRPFIKLGAGQIDGEISSNLAGSPHEYESEFGFAFGGGAEGTLYTWEEHGLDLFGSAQVEYMETGVDEVTQNGAATAVSNDEIEYFNWQVSLGVSKVFELGNHNHLVPYAGVEYRDVRLRTQFNTSTTGLAFESEADTPFGGFAGVNYEWNDRLSLGLEGRFGDENALSTSVNWEF